MVHIGTGHGYVRPCRTPKLRLMIIGVYIDPICRYWGSTEGVSRVQVEALGL